MNIYPIPPLKEKKNICFLFISKKCFVCVKEGSQGDDSFTHTKHVFYI